MKKLLIALLAIALISSCKDDGTDPAPDQSVEPFISYTIDGVDVKFENPTGQRMLTTVPDILFVKGRSSTANWPAMDLRIDKDSADFADGQTFTANKDNVFIAWCRFWGDGGKEYSTSQQGASLNITLDKIEFKKGGIAAGTFSGTVRDGSLNDYVITNGSFHVVIQD